MTPLNWAVLIVGLGAAVVIWWVSRRNSEPDELVDMTRGKASDKQLDMFTSTSQFDEFGVGKPRPAKVAPRLDGAPTSSQVVRGEAPQKIVALLIAEREGTHIFGAQVHAALRQHGLEFGAKQIYHRLVEGDAVYSVAGLLKMHAAGALDPGQLKYRQDLEQNLAQRIEAILLPVVGPGNARAQVAADIDFTETEQAEEIYKPNQKPEDSTVRSQQLSESGSQNGQAGGVPGAAPPCGAGRPGAPAGAAARCNRVAPEFRDHEPAGRAGRRIRCRRSRSPGSSGA